MNREAQLVAISSSFYKNVFLLTQVIPPSSDFEQHFRKGMFDKPNTAGFLHVSHYLSTVYNAKLFKRLVTWPVLCKKDEATYRSEMKNFLYVLSQDNPNLNFPSLLMSHLIQSGGAKFQFLMWKLSQLAVKAYLKQKFPEDLLNAPCISPVQNLAVTYFNNIIIQKYRFMTITHKETKKILDVANNFLSDQIEMSKVYKSEIFDKKENIKKLIFDLPVHPVIKTQLMNVEDYSIISLWKKNIFKKIQYIRKKNKELSDLDKFFKYLCKLILRISSNLETFDANKLPKVDCDYLYLRETQSNSVMFSTLLSLLHMTLTQMHHKNITDLSDLSQCLPFARNAYEKVKMLRTMYYTLIARICDLCRSERHSVLRKIKNTCVDFDESIMSVANCKILLQSPKISFDFNQNTVDHFFYGKLCPSPIEGKHKHLFKRYKHEYRPLRELPTSLLDLTSSWNNMSGWLSPRACSTRHEHTIFERKPSYSSKMNLKHREHVFRPSANYEGLNLTPRKLLGKISIRRSNINVNF